MIREQFLLGIDHEIIVDLFAGGGGMSGAIEQALGRHVDIAINHDSAAISMHMANHPQTQHYCCDVYEVDPREATQGRPVGHLHGSPDCTHHSQAAGGQPRSKKIRGLGWVLPRWAGQAKPRSISMENVKQMTQWGPLIAKRDPATGRVIKLDKTVAAPGERVPVQEQYLIPDPKHAGRTWRRFIRTLEQMGYQVEWRILCAADFGAATTRERLFLFARRDGRPIVWPEPTHFKSPKRRQQAWRPAADHIDWSLPCPSIFDRKRPLADATMRRIAKGMKRFVIDAAEPFIVPLTHHGSDRVHSAADPLRTITAAHRGELAVVAPTMVQAAHGDGQPGGVKRWGSGAKSATDPLGTITASGSGGQALAAATMVQIGYGEREGQAPRALDIEQPLGTVVAGGIKHGLTTAYMMQANGGFNATPGHDMREPSSTITNTGSQQQLVAATLAHLRGNCDARRLKDPLMTISAGGEHHGLVEYRLSREHEAGALRCAAFLMTYYGTGDNGHSLGDPLATVTTRDRLALVTVWLKGEPWVIVDIGLRMLVPPELYGCQGFPSDYIIDHGHDGRAFSKSAQVRMVGNSVSPPPAAALIRANCMDLAIWTMRELRELTAA